MIRCCNTIKGDAEPKNDRLAGGLSHLILGVSVGWVRSSWEGLIVSRLLGAY